jgi:hypothetical protein
LGFGQILLRGLPEVGGPLFSCLFCIFMTKFKKPLTVPSRVHLCYSIDTIDSEEEKKFPKKFYFKSLKKKYKKAQKTSPFFYLHTVVAVALVVGICQFNLQKPPLTKPTNKNVNFERHLSRIFFFATFKFLFIH